LSLVNTESNEPHEFTHQHKLTPVVAGAKRYTLPIKPLVTIITPTFNRAPYLEETIESVLSQDYDEIEYIILDDGSIDDTAQVLEKYQGCQRLTVFFHENMGETRTVNKGFSLATGDVVCVVNSDDPLLPGAISEAVRYLRCHPETLAAYPDWIEIGPQGEELARRVLPYYDIESMLLKFNVAMGPGTFIRRQAFDLIGYRDTALKYTGDLDFWFRLARVAPLGHMAEFLATHRRHAGAATCAERGEEMAEEIVRLVRNAYASNALSDQVMHNRHRAFCLAHYSASRQCGNRIGKAAKHFALAIVFGTGHLVSRVTGMLVNRHV
jgi:GT2 family glycosyltransferase